MASGQNNLIGLGDRLLRRQRRRRAVRELLGAGVRSLRRSPSAPARSSRSRSPTTEAGWLRDAARLLAHRRRLGDAAAERRAHRHRAQMLEAFGRALRLSAAPGASSLARAVVEQPLARGGVRGLRPRRARAARPVGALAGLPREEDRRRRSSSRVLTQPRAAGARATRARRRRRAARRGGCGRRRRRRRRARGARRPRPSRAARRAAARRPRCRRAAARGRRG